jgi:hypothetical protein
MAEQRAVQDWLGFEFLAPTRHFLPFQGTQGSLLGLKVAVSSFSDETRRRLDLFLGRCNALAVIQFNPQPSLSPLKLKSLAHIDRLVAD